jgi:hypothetical protein
VEGGTVTRRTWAVVAGLVLLAALAALLAHDVRGWRSAVRAGDARYEASPASARWSPATVLPSVVAGDLLGVRDDVDVRLAIRLFRLADRARGGLDTALQRQGTRARAELALADVARDAGPSVASQASDLLGVLAFGDVAAGGGRDPDQAGRAVSAFAEAVRLDPANESAKVNLELVLRLFQARGVRPGSSPTAGGQGTGRQGAGAGLPGRGY